MNVTGLGSVAAVCAGLIATTATADQVGTAIGRVEAGVFCPLPGGAAPAGNLPFIAQTRVVPAVIGIGFGVKAEAVLPGGIADVTITVTHPPFAASGATQQSFATSFAAGSQSAFYYRFDTAEEAVPGDWTIVAQAGGTLLYSLDFEVVQPSANDGLLQACGLIAPATQ